MCTKAIGRRQRGISMVELVIFIVIIGVAMSAIVSTMNLNTRLAVDPLVRKQALMLAEGMMEEVQLARFTLCDPADPAVLTALVPLDCATPEGAGRESGETRPYDNVSDYVTAYGTPQDAFNNGAGQLVDAAGQLINLPGYTVKLTIAPSDFIGPVTSTSTADAAHILNIRVAVSYNGEETIALEGYRIRYAPRSPP